MSLNSQEKVENEKKKYSNTVELLIAYLCVSKLRAFSASFGVNIKNDPDGGDYDCIANFQNSLFYFEVKSGDIKNIQINVLQSFLNRHFFLAPDASVLFLDFQGKNNSDIDQLILKFNGLNLGPNGIITQIIKIRDNNKKFYVIDSSILIVDLHNNQDILTNLRSAMQYFHRYNSFNRAMDYHIIEPSRLGYESEIIS